jgi:hypothetical protein
MRIRVRLTLTTPYGWNPLSHQASREFRFEKEFVTNLPSLFQGYGPMDRDDVLSSIREYDGLCWAERTPPLELGVVLPYALRFYAERMKPDTEALLVEAIKQTIRQTPDFLPPAEMLIRVEFAQADDVVVRIWNGQVVDD